MKIQEPTHRIINGPFSGREVYFKGPTDTVLVEMDTPGFGRLPVQISLSNLKLIEREDKTQKSATATLEE